MIQPINGHILIKPLKHEGFVASSKETYEEIGEVLEFDVSISGVSDANPYEVRRSLAPVRIGDRVYFDSWLAAKYPTGTGNEFFWLVKFEDVRAIEHAKD